MPDDNAILAAIIRSVLAEFGANKPGTVYYDASTDVLYELFRQNKAWYFVAEEHAKLAGGAGIFPTAGLPENTCELVKMYLLSSARGRGIGRSLIQACFDQARAEGYKQIYLETMPELKNAVSVYEKCGFKYLSGPLGNTGHFGCDLWMLKDLYDGIDAAK